MPKTRENATRGTSVRKMPSTRPRALDARVPIDQRRLDAARPDVLAILERQSAAQQAGQEFIVLGPPDESETALDIPNRILQAGAPPWAPQTGVGHQHVRENAHLEQRVVADVKVGAVVR